MLQYVLPQCWFSPVKLRQMEKKSMGRIISKCGYSSRTPHAILYGPRDFAGTGFLHWTTIQGEGQILHFIKHWRTNTNLSKLMHICLGWAQFQSGMRSSILEDVTTPIPHVKSQWLQSLWSILATAHGWIQLDTTFCQPHERMGNQHIMDFAIASGEFTHSDLLPSVP